MSDSRSTYGHLAYRSLFLTPALAVLGIAEWFVPLTSPPAPGHALYVVFFIHFPYLIGLACASLLTIHLARRRDGQRRALDRPVAWLQWLLIAMLVIGGIPVLAFNVRPDTTLQIGSVLHQVFGVLAAGAVLTQWMLLRRHQPRVQAAN